MTQKEREGNGGIRMLWWFGAIVFGIALAAANCIYGSLNQDEGWYLLASLCVADGQLPYRDFFFTQGPVMPLVYGAFAKLWAPYGVLGGRVLTAVFGLVAAAIAARIAAQLAPQARRSEAALTAWLLTACVPVHSYFSVISKTYALASLLLMLGFLYLMRKKGRAMFIAGMCIALAAATRISMGVVLPVVGLALLMRCTRPDFKGAWWKFGLGAALTLTVTYGAMYLRHPEMMTFAHEYHAVRATGGLVEWLTLRAGFASRCIQAYPLTWVLAAVLFIGLRAWRGSPRVDSSTEIKTFEDFRVSAFVRDLTRFADRTVMRGSGLFLWSAAIAALAMTLVHGLSPFPYDDYQTPVMPVMAIVVAAVLWQWLDSAASSDVVRKAPLLLCIATVFMALSSPLLMDWKMIRKDRFWFEMKEKPDILALRELGKELREKIAPSELLLTQDAYLVVEARRKVPRGLEMGPFCLFPELSDKDARRYHVHNINTLKRLIAESDTAPIALTSGYSFSVACPETQRLPEDQRHAFFTTLNDYYDLVDVKQNFGQGHTEVQIWQRRPR